MELELDDGTRVTGLRRPAQGTRHRILFGTEVASGREVAAKIEMLPGTLEPERRALEWLGAHGGPAPRLHAAGRVVSPEEDGDVCLVMDRSEGEAPSLPPAWERMGRALARLARLPWEGSGLVVHDHHAFLADHERRVEDLMRASGLERSDGEAASLSSGSGLDEVARAKRVSRADLAETLPSVPASYTDSPLVLTHGDPGPGNFLDDGGEGTLIDWEDAQVAPRGLDLGRAAFIALLGAGPEGYVAEDRTKRARAVVAGFLDESADSFAGEDFAWWLAVAGVQFAHRRLEREGEPGVLPWRDAVAVLDQTLGRDPAGWIPPR